jgi:hypothetical protein
MRITDSDAFAYLTSQLAHIEKTIWERKYTPIIYDELVPVSNEAGEWDKSVEVHYMDGITEGKFIGSDGDDMPFARATTGRDLLPIKYAGIGYEYTLEELRQSAYLQMPLDARLGMQARRGYEEHVQRTCFLGDAARGLEGLLNHSVVGTAAAATTWAVALSTSVDALLTLVNEPINAIITGTNGIEIPDRMLIPISQFNLLATTRLNTVSDQTVLEYIRLKNAATARTKIPLDIRPLPQLTGKAVVYSSSPEVMVMHIPLPLRFVAPQTVNLKVRIPGEYKLSGVEMRYPGAVIYRTGI